MTVRLVVGATTDVGRVRDHNEDAYLVDDDMGLVAVADGMGGHQAGEVASATALEALRSAVRSGQGIREAVEAANDAVYEKSTSDERLQGMGTTLTAATLAAGGTLLLGHVGDSRAYLRRDGELRRVTSDHSVIEELVQSGELTEAQAETDPRRSMITRALGLEPGVEVDLYPIELRAGDRLMLCSDGLTSMVRDDAIKQVLDEEADPSNAANRLVEMANEAGGTDNVTVVVIDVVDAPAEAAAAAAGVSPAATSDALETTAPVPAVVAGERGTRRRIVWRVVRWVAPVVALLGIAIGVVAWYARTHYYVGSSLKLVAVYHGVPDGLLWFEPTLEDRTSGLRLEDLTRGQRREVLDGKTFSSREDAIAFVDRLCREARRDREASCKTSKEPKRSSRTTTTTTTTTTTPQASAPPTTIPPPLT